MQIDQKWDCLRSLLAGMEGAVLAYSGGVDSSLLLRAAAETMGSRLIAVTAVSETYPPGELDPAKQFAAALNAKHLVLPTGELARDAFARNAPDRCYHCKGELFGKLRQIADAEGVPFVLDGSNADDLHDYRPGRTAAREHAVRSPLAEAGLTKQNIRSLARSMGLPMWNKPSLACLSSRIPYGTRITPDLLRTIQAAEDIVRSAGIGQVRVRHHGDMARIEVAQDDIMALANAGVRGQIVAAFKELGYAYVCLDLEGYRTGSMNETLDRENPSSVTR
ncbi:MAG: ATP-dependent sacrificial sulfur transferase LarE [Nitrospirota bacterium]